MGDATTSFTTTTNNENLSSSNNDSSLPFVDTTAAETTNNNATTESFLWWPIVVAAVVCLCCVAALVAFMSFRNRDKQHDTFEDDGNNLAVVDSFLNSETRQDFTYKSPEAADQDNVYTAFPNAEARSSEVLYEELRPSGVYDTVPALQQNNSGVIYDSAVDVK